MIQVTVADGRRGKKEEGGGRWKGGGGGEKGEGLALSFNKVHLSELERMI